MAVADDIVQKLAALATPTLANRWTMWRSRA